MREATKRIGVALLAAVSIGAATIATSAPAEARWHGGGGWHGGYHRGGGWVGPAIVGGLALGAIAASRPYGYGYGYGYPAYGGYDGCLRRRVVGYTPYGRPIVRAVNVCY